MGRLKIDIWGKERASPKSSPRTSVFCQKWSPHFGTFELRECKRIMDAQVWVVWTPPNSQSWKLMIDLLIDDEIYDT